MNEVTAPLLIKTDNTIEKIFPKNQHDFQLEELKEFVGGYIEIIYLPKNLIMVLNEEGKLFNLPYNAIATTLFRASFPTNDYIVGNVLICHTNLVK